MHGSIRTRLLAVFIGLATIPLLLVGVFLGTLSFTTQQQEAILRQQEIAIRVSSQVNDFMQQFEHDLRSAIQVRGFKGLDREQQRDVLGTLISLQPAFSELALLDNKGQELTHISRRGFISEADLVNRSSADEYTVPIQTGKTYYSAVWVDSTTGEPLMRLAVPILDIQSGTVENILIADVRFKPVWDLLASLSTIQADTVYILDAEGQVIAHQNPSFVLKGTHLSVPDDGLRVGLNGAWVVSGISQLQFGQQTYTVVAERLTSDALALAINTVIVAVVLVLIALAVAIGMGYMMVNRITEPIQMLATTAQAIMDGDLSRQAQVTSSDEIGRLATAFNNMTSRLAQSISTLDRRVADRTRDLKAAAEVAHQITTVLNPQALLLELVNLTKESFGLHQARVFLYNQQSGILILAAESGQDHQESVEPNKQFHIDDQASLVSLAARTRLYAVSGDESTPGLMQSNVIISKTTSEATFPIMYGDRMLGVLDLQSKEANRFSSKETEVFETFANQIAVAIRNAELFEQAHAAREQAEQADRVKSAFLASMSHELRTPLNAIINFTRFVVKGMSGPVNEQQVATLNEVIDSSKHLLSLINDVLDMSKIQAGSLRLFIEDNVDLTTIVDTVVTTGTGLIADKPIKIETDIQPNLPPIRADRQRILQVMLNIMSNACKFTEEGCIRVSVRQEKDEILFSIADTGPGIAPQDSEAVFEAFKQTETGLRQVGGTGLGMPISKSLVQAHGGKLWFESQLGKGTTFYVVLPVLLEALLPSVVS